MATGPGRDTTQPSGKTLSIWSVPVEEAEDPQPSVDGTQPKQGPSNRWPKISEAVATIKTEDFANVAKTPCARNGFLTGIATGAGLGGLRFVLKGNVASAANWAVGLFVLGSTVSYEYCQFKRRAERLKMKRHIEIMSDKKREQAQKEAEEKREQLARQQEEKTPPQKSWYKFW